MDNSVYELKLFSFLFVGDAVVLKPGTASIYRFKIIILTNIYSFQNGIARHMYFLTI